jgi:hypothetical protein
MFMSLYYPTEFGNNRRGAGKRYDLCHLPSLNGIWPFCFLGNAIEKRWDRRKTKAISRKKPEQSRTSLYSRKAELSVSLYSEEAKKRE